VRIFLTLAALSLAGLLAASGSEMRPPSASEADRLKAQVLRLEAELEQARQALQMAEEKAFSRAGAVWLLDDFESPERWQSPGGGGWWAGGDQNGMGTVVDPDPYTQQAGGCPQSPGYSGGIAGHLGPAEEPYSWANFSYAWWEEGGQKYQDLRAYKALVFWIRGDGNPVKVTLDNKKVEDHDTFQAEVATGPQWKKVVLPLEEFKQKGWGKAIASKLEDVKGFSFSPTLHDADFEFRIDQFGLAK
jgi:outer membrane murein-binding lipoprotein Lpp